METKSLLIIGFITVVLMMITTASLFFISEGFASNIPANLILLTCLFIFMCVGLMISSIKKKVE